MMDKLSPDERAQAAKMQENMRREMQDMQHVAMKLKPSDTDPDAPVSNFVVLTTLATSPLMAKLGETADESVLDKLEELIVGFGSLSAGQIAAFQQENAPIIRRNVTLLKMSESSDATLLQKLEEIVVEAELLKTSDLEPVKDPL